MEPSYVKQIEVELEKEAKWSVDKLLFEILGSPPFHIIIPYLGDRAPKPGKSYHLLIRTI
jgi:hypothetical protein